MQPTNCRFWTGKSSGSLGTPPSRRGPVRSRDLRVDTGDPVRFRNERLRLEIRVPPDHGGRESSTMGRHAFMKDSSQSRKPAQSVVQCLHTKQGVHPQITLSFRVKSSEYPREGG